MSIACKVRPIGGEALLPDGYRRCEYLESTGTQWIDTGFTPKMGDEFNLDFSIDNSLIRSYPLISAGNGENQIILLALREPTHPETRSNLYFRYFCDIAKPVNIKLFQKNKFSIYKDGKGFINGTYCGQSLPLGEVNTSLLLYKRVASPLICQGRVYSLSISHNNQLQLNLIPCLDDKGKPCMFDTVSRTSYYNEGTGDFLYKLKTPVIRKLPRGYQPLDYLESNGTQWIDTGVKLSNESEVECKFERTAYDTDSQAIFGVYSPEPRYTLLCNLAGDSYLRLVAQNGSIFSKKIQNGEQIKFFKKNTNVYINDELVGTFTEQNETSVSCRIFSATPAYYANARIYSFSISRNGVLQLDFHPCLDPAGKPCMWDYVTRRPFYNQDTTGSDFLYG